MLLDQDATRQHRKEAERKEETAGRKDEENTGLHTYSVHDHFYVAVHSFLATNLIERTHSGDGADVVGDSDQRCPGQVLFGHRLPLVFGHHVAKTTKSRQQSSSVGGSNATEGFKRTE